MSNDIKISSETDILVVVFCLVVFCCVAFVFEIAKFVLLSSAEKTDLLHLK